jgi:hypothetical protein
MLAPPLLPVCQWVLKPGIESTRRAFLPCSYAPGGFAASIAPLACSMFTELFGEQ